MVLQVVPELLCSDVEASKSFFVEVLGFTVKYKRPEERFVYLARENVDLMLEEIGDQRQWITGKLEKPFGRGLNLQWDVTDIDKMYQRVVELSPNSIYLELEQKAYKCGKAYVSQKRFIVQVPDGYLFRFCQELGERTAGKFRTFVMTD